VPDTSYYPSDFRIPGIEDTDEAYFATVHAARLPLSNHAG
jgi:hypothetical protein